MASVTSPANCDIARSLYLLGRFKSQNENEKWALDNPLHPVNIFDYRAKWTIERLDSSDDEWEDSLVVVMERVRSFLAEWVAGSAREANW